ncbi:MAG TPA: hypothetical protein VK489_11720, partial [Ferruginibacter sp.]|nr:hypothetical protein [Ferruginibacter sp.]
MNTQNFSPPSNETSPMSEFGLKRRNLLKYMGLSAAVIAIGSSCDKDDNPIMPNGGVNLGSGDVGILNYAYALEQLEAAFYV